MSFEKIKIAHLPMTETAFYILLSLTEPRSGYGIIKHVEDITDRPLILGSETIYGTLTKMQRDGIITVYAEEKRNKIYEITSSGKMLMREEMKRRAFEKKNSMLLPIPHDVKSFTKHRFAWIYSPDRLEARLEEMASYGKQFIQVGDSEENFILFMENPKG